MVRSLDEIGVSILHGAASTFLAVLALAAAQTYIFSVLFKSFFGIVVFGASHSLILLPVLLSLFPEKDDEIGPE